MMVIDTSSIYKLVLDFVFVLYHRKSFAILDNKCSGSTFSDNPLHSVIHSASDRSGNSHISCLMSLTSKKQKWQDCLKAEKSRYFIKILSLFTLKVRESAKARDEIRSGTSSFIQNETASKNLPIFLQWRLGGKSSTEHSKCIRVFTAKKMPSACTNTTQHVLA